MKKYNIISLCDGISCGRIALEEEGFEIGNFYSSEIEPNATKMVFIDTLLEKNAN